MVDKEKKQTSAQRRLAGVMGWPVEHSLSPRVHGFWLKKYGIEGEYVKFAVEPGKLEAALRALPHQGFAGVNLTVPHKEAALALMDRLDPLAQRVGAVNTVVAGKDGKLEGRNTDVFGFAENLRAAGFRPGGTTVILGAGGAARAAVAALLDMGIKDIRIVNRTRQHAERLAADFGLGAVLYPWSDAAALEDAQLLVNATSLGLKGQPPLEIGLDALPPSAWVTDMVYAPLETEFLKRARVKGHKTLDGLGMLLHQARPAFEAFFGLDPEVNEELRNYVVERLK